MSEQSQAVGRQAQKERTRSAIVAAARGLAQPSVEEAADAAGVSRATAYRYFPTQEALSVELVAEDIWRDVEGLLNAHNGEGALALVERLIEVVVAVVYRDERHVRAAMRVYHDTWLRDPATPVRKGRRMSWIDRAIRSLPDLERARLRLPLALAIGPDQVTMLKDVAALGEAETVAVLTWTARALFGAAVRSAGDAA